MRSFVHKALRRRIGFALLLLAAVLTAALYITLPQQSCVEIVSPKNPDMILFRIPARTGDRFTLTYRHSVSNSMVEGAFLLTAGSTITPLTTSFSSFGPGLPMTDTEETVTEDGLITVFHQEEPRDKLRLWVSPLTGETLKIGTQQINLAAFAGQPLLVEITFVSGHQGKASLRRLRQQHNNANTKQQ